MPGGGHINYNNNEWKFQSCIGANLGYDMIFESVNSDQEEKNGNVLNSNRTINLTNLITNIDNFFVCKECAQEGDLQIN